MQKFGYEYNADGLVSRHTDSVNGKTYNYTYDMLGRLQRTEVSDGSSIAYTYDNVNNVTNTSYRFNGITKSTTYNHFKGGVVCDVTYPNGAVKTRSLNGQAQVRPSTLTTPTGQKWSINRNYYTPNPNDTVKYTTDLIGSLIYENIDRTFTYTYNGSGNISKITDKTGTVSKDSTFVYDEANQLIRENNAYTNKTVTYTYDEGGNILAKTEYPFTTGSLDGLTGTVINYTYGNTNWKDLLTAYNGKAITYDEIGNPLTYYNGTTFTWERGRKLATATTADGTAVSYLYNDSGIRTQKTVDGVATNYFLDGSKIIAEKTGNDVKWYYYDGDGTREAIEYKGNVYYYFYNAQGDVMGLFDDSLNVVVNYTYDSWGNVVSITGSMADTLGHDNPFRYRGYYFDSDTGLYYLNSRYYDANTGKFINADGFVQTGQGLLDKNMFAYCENDPINRTDSNGNSWKDVKEWVSDKWTSIKSWANRTFGTNYSVVMDLSESIDVKLPIYSPVTAKVGESITEVISSTGNSSKPVTVYATKNMTHPYKSSSIGVKVTAAKFTFKINLSVDNINVSGSVTNDNITKGFGAKASISDFSIGFQGTTEIKWDNNTTEKFYTDVGLNGYTVLALYYLLTTGQPAPNPQLQPA